MSGKATTLRNGAVINDKRKHGTPWGYIVMTDACLSGWGGANGGTSLYAVAVNTSDEVAIVEDNATARSEMQRPRLILSKRADGTPRVTMGPNDHMSVVDGGSASAWYEKGAWK